LAARFKQNDSLSPVNRKFEVWGWKPHVNSGVMVLLFIKCNTWPAELCVCFAVSSNS